MTVLVDPPLWPRHGTVWGHLVSDTSYAELHVFAERAGIPRRAFDHDHYDVPAERWDDVVALGAEPVDARDLVRRLRASGLRVTARDRRPRAPLRDGHDRDVPPAGTAPSRDRAQSSDAAPDDA
ncbi:DUF4031 domain-containing protein [Cellulomonas xiejunii]|uniref:DUF4031 domain-containing protein n=1 Tax=Cellulomonas xiejunii TaxID=2968083 RepID=UPI0027E09237|nr:DUF4031 domain-containing protein [Cellulomonas xiejunii]